MSRPRFLQQTPNFRSFENKGRSELFAGLFPGIESSHFNIAKMI